MIESKEKRGITLIALVITIVVLLILAGVGIATLTGPNGILTQANKAKTATEEAGEKEKRKLAQTEANIHLTKTEYTEVVNGETKTVPIPAGFAMTNIEGESTVKEGLVITDAKGNEYVWIPCTIDGANGTLQYKRTECGVESDPTDNPTRASKDELTLEEASVTYSETDIANGINADISKEIVAQIKAEKASVQKNGGYYIGRYEVGKEGTTAVVKANKEPYASIKWSKAYSLAKEIGGGTEATTYLCSSYAWDTAINFIQNNSGKTNYATSIENMNENGKDREVKDKLGNVIKPSGQSIRLSTGLTTAKCNIYDMGGNVAEFTTEINPGTSETVVSHGGNYDWYSTSRQSL